MGAALWVGFWGILSFWLGKGVLVYVKEFHALTPFLLGFPGLALLAGGAYLRPRYRRGRAEPR